VADDGDARAPGPRHASGTSAPAFSALIPARQGVHRAPPRRRTWLLLSLAGLAAVALVAALVLRPGPSRESTAPARDDPVWAELVEWTDTELDPGTRVTVPADVRPALVAAGDGERFVADDAVGALVLIRGNVPQEATVLARFATDEGSEFTLADPAPGQPTPDELERRRNLSVAILANPHVGATGRAADVLGRGNVDARLLGLLAVLVTQLDIGVADFPPAPGEPAVGPLARPVLIDRAGTSPVAPGTPAADDVLAFLDAQRPPFAPDAVEVTDEGILVAFRYASAPDALITADTP
jgi:hypothetical protein